MRTSVIKPGRPVASLFNRPERSNKGRLPETNGVVVRRRPPVGRQGECDFGERLHAPGDRFRGRDRGDRTRGHRACDVGVPCPRPGQSRTNEHPHAFIDIFDESIARERPEVLREILGRLRAPAPSYRRSLEALDDAEDPGGSQSGVLAENPDLADYYRESPEAALDLLRLIREATKER